MVKKGRLKRTNRILHIMTSESLPNARISGLSGSIIFIVRFLSGKMVHRLRKGAPQDTALHKCGKPYLIAPSTMPLMICF